MSITRIQNNQITDSTIVAYAKLQSGSLTGNLFAPTVTLNSNVTINGNLFLSNTGNATTINATNTYINDPIVVFNNGYSGSLTGYDIGMLVNRNLSPMAPYGSQVNTAWVWVEADQAFEAIATTDVGTGAVSINTLGFANTKVGNSTVTGFQAVTGALTVTSGTTLNGAAQINSTLGATGIVTITNATNNNGLSYTNGALQVTGGAGFGGNVYIGGNAIVMGNVVTAGNVNVVNVTGNSAQFFGNAAGFGALYAGINTGFVYQPQTVLQSSTNFNGYAQLNHQNINSGSLASSDYVATANNGTANDTYIDLGIASSTYNYPGFGLLRPNDGYLLVYGNTVTKGGNLVLGAGGGGLDNDIIFAVGGFDTSNEFGRIDGTGNIFVIKSAVASTSTTTGAITVAGGVGIQGAVYAGSIQATPIGSTTPNSGAFTTLTASGVTQVTNATAASNTTSGALQVTGGAGVQGALYAGTSYDNGNRVLTSVTSTGSGNITVSGTAPSLTLALPATGPGATTWGGPTQLPSITFDVYGRATTASNIALNTVAVTNLGNTGEITANASVGLVGLNLTTTGVAAGNYGNATTIPTIVADSKGRILSLTSNSVLASYNLYGTSGVVVVASTGTGGGSFTINGNFGVTTTASGSSLTIATPQDLQITANPTFNKVTTASVQGVIGNVTPAAATFTTETVTGASNLNTVTAASVQAVIGNATPNTGAFTTLTASGVTQVTNATQNNGTTYTSGALQVTGGAGIGGNLFVAGNLIVQGTATTINTETITGSEIVVGQLTANSGTASTSTTTGALLVSGGAGITGAVYAGSIQATPIGSTTPSTGAFTTLTADTLTGTSFQGVIGNATPQAATFTGVTVNNTLTATTVNAATIGNAGAVLTGTLSTSAQTNVTSVGTLTGLTVSGTTNLGTTNTGALASTGTITASTVNAATIGNSGATLNGTLSSGPQNNITSVGALTSLAVSGSTNLQNTTATTLSAATIGNSGAVLTGTLSTASQPNVTALGNLSTLSVAGTTTSWGNIVAAATTPSTSTTTGAIVVPNGGLGVEGNITVGHSGSVHKLIGNILIGATQGGASASTTLEVNQNTVTPFNSTSVVHIFSKEQVSGKVTLDSVGTNGATSQFVARTANGTAANPTSVDTNQVIGAFIARGYGSTGFQLNVPGTSAGVILRAAEEFTDSAQGTTLSLNVIPIGGNTSTPAIFIDSGGNVLARNHSTVSGDFYTIGNITTANNMSVLGTSYFASQVGFDGQLLVANTTPTNDTTTGAIVVQGGIATAGNINAAGQLFVGTGAQTTILTNAFIVERGTSTTGPGNQYTQHAIINDTNTGSSDFVAYGNNYPGPSNDHGWMDAGFTGDAYNDPVYSITKSNDGYVFASGANASVGGNLVLATDYSGAYNDIVIGVGSFSAESEVARFHGNATTNGSLVLKLPTPNTLSANTGALQVWGGASISGNTYIGGATLQMGGALFNHNRFSAGTAGASNQNAFIIQGVNDSTLLYAKPLTAYDSLIVGGDAASSTFPGGAKLVVNSTDSMLLPTGTTAQRPSSIGFSDVAGMTRYNTTTGSIEFYDGTAWKSTNQTFTVITDQQFTASGTDSVFTLTSPSTTASSIVSINGIVQTPTLAYSISGTTLSFTENPAYSDIIDVRALTTTTTISQLNDPSGINGVQMVAASSGYGNLGIVLATGVTSGGGAVNQYGIDSRGGFVTLSPNVTVATSGVATVVDSLFANAYSSAEYTVTSTIQGTNIREISKIHLIHSGDKNGAGTASVIVYGNVNTAGNSLVSWTAGVSGNIAQLKATTTNNNTILRIKRNYQAI